MSHDGMGTNREKAPMRVVEYAGFRRRAAAAAIDAVLLITASWFVVPALAYAWTGDLTEMAADALEIHPGDFGQLFPIYMAILGVMVCATALALSWIYGALMESSARQATIGKMAFGMVVTDSDGHRISFPRGMSRNLGKIASALPVFVGLFMVGTTARKQGLHDILTGCLVVVKPK